MHELGLMKNLVDTIQTYAQKNGLLNVVKVRLEVGKFSGIVPEALEFCFDFCVKDTVLEGALLEIERVPATGKCKSCLTTFDLFDNDFSCPLCGAADWELISGKEFIIKYLEGI